MLATAVALRDGARSVGFLYISNSPLTAHIPRIHAASEWFFALPDAAKAAVRTDNAQRGYHRFQGAPHSISAAHPDSGADSAAVPTPLAGATQDGIEAFTVANDTARVDELREGYDQLALLSPPRLAAAAAADARDPQPPAVLARAIAGPAQSVARAASAGFGIAAPLSSTGMATPLQGIAAPLSAPITAPLSTPSAFLHAGFSAPISAPAAFPVLSDAARHQRTRAAASAGSESSLSESTVTSAAAAPARTVATSGRLADLCDEDDDEADAGGDSGVAVPLATLWRSQHAAAGLPFAPSVSGGAAQSLAHSPA